MPQPKKLIEVAMPVKEVSAESVRDKSITIKEKSTHAAPLTENSQQYKIIRESASQLGLELNEED